MKRPRAAEDRIEDEYAAKSDGGVCAYNIRKVNARLCSKRDMAIHDFWLEETRPARNGSSFRQRSGSGLAKESDKKGSKQRQHRRKFAYERASGGYPRCCRARRLRMRPRGCQTPAILVIFIPDSTYIPISGVFMKY